MAAAEPEAGKKIFHALIEKLFIEIENRLKTENNGVLLKAEYLKLHSIFGMVFGRALQIIDSQKIILYNSEILEISENNIDYKLFSDVNYCSCEAFYYQVILHENSYTCKHVLAGKLAKLLNKIENKTITDDQLQFLMKQMLE